MSTSTVSTKAGSTVADPFEQLWPLIRTDMAGLQDVIPQLSPTPDVKQRLSAARVTTASYPLAGVLRSLMRRLPARIEHLLIVPWIGGVGGSETVTSRLVEALLHRYPDGGFCVFAPETNFKRHGESKVPIIAINDIDPNLDIPSRVELLDRILIERQPRVVHTVNSFIAWLCFSAYGRFYARNMNLYGNLYSDVRSPLGEPIAYFFWQSLPQCIDHMAGIFVDNQRIVDRARECFGFVQSEMEKFHLLRTPVLGITGGDPAAELVSYTPGRPKRTLWMSRISAEKRLDILQAIAERCPHRKFSIYGSAIGVTVDLSGLIRLPNVELVGAFGDIRDIPVTEYDSYLFTTSVEGAPCSILEMAARGLPVIAPYVGGIPEFINNETGWLISGPDAVEEYVGALHEIETNGPEAMRRTRNAQNQLLKSHTWDVYQRTLTNVPGYLGV